MSKRKQPKYVMPEFDALGRRWTNETWLVYLRSSYRDLLAQARREAHTSRGGTDRELEHLRQAIAAASVTP